MVINIHLFRYTVVRVLTKTYSRVTTTSTEIENNLNIPPKFLCIRYVVICSSHSKPLGTANLFPVWSFAFFGLLYKCNHTVYDLSSLASFT